MFQSLEHPEIKVTCDELQKLYPTIVITDDTYTDDLNFLGVPYKNLNIEVLRHEIMNRLQDEFNLRVTGAFKTSQGYLMQFDTSDSLKMQGAITLMEAVSASTGYITQANDVTVYNIPIETMKQVLVEMLNAYAQCHARKQELRALINNAQTKEELDEIVISWPI